MEATVPNLSTTLESYFKPFRDNILGINQTFESPYGQHKILYTDWTASGRLYGPIEKKILNEFGPFVANTHTETTVSGTTMTRAYHKARHIIKNHVNAGPDDILLTTGTGMTGAVNKFQRILGLKVPERVKDLVDVPTEVRPVIFVSHMEHHSNQTSWLETLATVEVIPSNENGLFCLSNLERLLEKYKNREVKIASITSCSNVTGIKTPYHEVAKLMHQHNGLCFVDFACSAPYIDIDMHPEDSDMYLDALFMSPHKFLGGPGSSGVLIFNKKLYKNLVPDCPGGGTVDWTTPWGTHKFIEDIEEREDGGTPGFLQVIKTSLAMKLKEQMGVDKILQREKELLEYFFENIKSNEKINILAGQHEHRLAVVSFTVDGLHHDLAVKILNDRYGIQTRGGCSCAGTYGHYLLQIDQLASSEIIEKVSCGLTELKPGWVRISFHPTTSNEEIVKVCEALHELADNAEEWKKDYVYEKGHFRHKLETPQNDVPLRDSWFEL